MPYTITIYLKSDNDIYMKLGLIQCQLQKNVSVGIGLNTLNTQSVIVAYVVSVYRSTAAVKNIKAALTAGLLWTVNPNEHTKVRKINSFIKTNHLENAYE